MKTSQQLLGDMVAVVIVVMVMTMMMIIIMPMLGVMRCKCVLKNKREGVIAQERENF